MTLYLIKSHSSYSINIKFRIRKYHKIDFTLIISLFFQNFDHTLSLVINHYLNPLHDIPHFHNIINGISILMNDSKNLRTFILVRRTRWQIM